MDVLRIQVGWSGECSRRISMLLSRREQEQQTERKWVYGLEKVVREDPSHAGCC